MTASRGWRFAVRGAEVENEYVRKVVAHKTTVPHVQNENPEGGQGRGSSRRMRRVTMRPDAEGE
jgi:hypothetical protein